MIIGNTYWFQSRDRHSDHLSLLDILDLWAWIYANLAVTFYFHVHGSLWRCLFSMFLLSGAICGRRSETVTQSTQHSTTLCRLALHKSQMALNSSDSYCTPSCSSRWSRLSQGAIDTSRESGGSWTGNLSRLSWWQYWRSTSAGFWSTWVHRLHTLLIVSTKVDARHKSRWIFWNRMIWEADWNCRWRLWAIMAIGAGWKYG